MFSEAHLVCAITPINLLSVWLRVHLGPGSHGFRLFSSEVLKLSQMSSLLFLQLFYCCLVCPLITSQMWLWATHRHTLYVLNDCTCAGVSQCLTLGFQIFWTALLTLLINSANPRKPSHWQWDNEESCSIINFSNMLRIQRRGGASEVQVFK